MNVDIISGFLGAGKTTLLNKIIPALSDDIKAKAVLIENEFGEAGIDGDLISGGLPVRELYAGCVCCTLKAKLQQPLNNIAEEFNDAYVLLEPSGVGQLSDVIAACELAENFKVRHRIVVVDASSYFDYCDGFGDFYMDQVEHASLIVFSHIKDLSEIQREKLFDAIRAVNNKAYLYSKDWFNSESAGLELAALLDSLDYENFNLEHEHEHNHQDEDEQILDSLSVFNIKDFASVDEVKNLLSKFKDFKIFRAKGLIKICGKIFKFDFTPYHSSLEEFNNSNLEPRAVIIGKDLNAELRNLFI